MESHPSKLELIKWHSRLYRLTRGIYEDDPIMKPYYDFGVYPTHIHRHKNDHGKAIDLLIDILIPPLEEPQYRGRNRL